MSIILNDRVEEYEELEEEQLFTETPFIVDPPSAREQEGAAEVSGARESSAGQWEASSPFLPGESYGSGEINEGSAEASALAEMMGELKDSQFQEALEQLADEAVDAHQEQLSAEYGDHETESYTAERVLTEHLQPLAAQAEAMLDRFAERWEAQQSETIGEHEVEHMVGEIAAGTPVSSPAAEQFLGGLMRKVGKIASGAVRLATKIGGTLALGPLFSALKKLAKGLLAKVVRFAVKKLPPSLRPIGQKLIDRLAGVAGIAHEQESEDREQAEGEVIPAAEDAGRLETEFDLHAAQLMFVRDEPELDHLVSTYEEDSQREGQPSLAALDRARAKLVDGLAKLQKGESAEPHIEHFLPALYAAVKLAVSIIGRSKVTNFLGGLMAKLIAPLIGAEGARVISPHLADTGLRILGLEVAPTDSRTVAAEALAATIEETLTSVGELPVEVLENETLLGNAVSEAFENAAAAYFPDAIIKNEYRETSDHNGMWAHMPRESRRKEYAKYSQSIPVTIMPRVARSVETFGHATLHDHIRDHLGEPAHQPLKAKVSLYQALPGTTARHIARREGFPHEHLHPLTPHAAAALLGPNAALGSKHTPGAYLSSPNKLHVGQRLYRIEPPNLHRHRRVRTVRSELHINLPKGRIQLWLYLSEPLCQRISAELAAGKKGGAIFGHLKPLLRRTSSALKMALHERHLPREILIVSETPNLERRVTAWARHVGERLSGKIGLWASTQVAQYFQNKAEEFRRLCAAKQDGVTLRITMRKIPGIEMLRTLSKSHATPLAPHHAWPAGAPEFEVLARAGYLINR